jgi:DNA topoisomerase IA
MDKNGIGTDATIAQHIETIQNRVSGAWTEHEQEQRVSECLNLRALFCAVL